MVRIFRCTLKQNFMSLPFIISAAAVLAAGGYEAFIYYSEYYDFLFQYTQILDGRFPQYLMFLFAVLPCLLTGREFSSAVIRNKIVSGTKKTEFFIAHLLVNCLITAILVLLYFLPKLIFCTGYLMHFEPFFVCFAIMSMCFGYILITAAATVISAMSDRVVISIVISIAAALAGLLCFNLTNRLLREPVYDVVGSVQAQENDEASKVPNPHYIENKTARTVLLTVQHLTPFDAVSSGDMIISDKITSMKEYKEAENDLPRSYPYYRELHDSLFCVPLYTTGMTVFVSVLGLFLFKRRNLK